MATEGGHLERAQALLDLGRLDHARDAIEKALAEDPESARAWALLSRVEYNAKEYRAALTAARNGLERSPGHMGLHLAASHAATANGQGYNGYEHAMEALRIWPGNPDAHAAAARSRLQPNNEAARAVAEDHIRQAREAAPNWTEPTYLEAQLQVQRNQIAAAKQSLHLVLAMDPEADHARLFLADLERFTGGSGKAADYIQTALLLDPNDTDARKRLDELIREAMISLAWLAFAAVIFVFFVLAAMSDTGGG